MTNIKPKTESPLKYLIDQIIKEKLDRDISVARFIGYLEHKGITLPTFNRDKSILLADSNSIPEYRLQVYAKALGVEMTDLINYEVIQKKVNEVHAEALRQNKRHGATAKSFQLEK